MLSKFYENADVLAAILGTNALYLTLYPFILHYFELPFLFKYFSF